MKHNSPIDTNNIALLPAERSDEICNESDTNPIIPTTAVPMASVNPNKASVDSCMVITKKMTRKIVALAGCPAIAKQKKSAIFLLLV
jgi:hypothetical protein